MRLEQVKGNTWVMIGWEYIPFYKIDETHCIMLDTGLVNQQEDLINTLSDAGLTCVGVLGSHAHIDHMGSYAYLQRNGAKLALALEEAGILVSFIGLNSQYHNISYQQVRENPSMQGTTCVPDRIIMPDEERIEFCGVEFDIIHTPGHTPGHICVRTPDNVLYLADAMMTGKTLYRSKFPFALSMEVYMDSMRKLRTESADKYIVAHEGIYNEILPLLDMELRFLRERMLDLLDLIDETITPGELASAICKEYGIGVKRIYDLSYFEQASQAYLCYLRDEGYLENYNQDYRILYRKTEKGRNVRKKIQSMEMPKTGLFR